MYQGAAGSVARQMLLLECLLAGALLAATAGVPQPTARQVGWQATPLRAFFHFSICTFSGCEHNSGSGSWGSGPASAFDPRRADPEQWVLAAKAFGAGGAVLTARHEGGFCLFPSNHSNYTIAQSPLAGRDLVAEFVAACRKHGLKPSLYFAASCDGWHKNGAPLSASAYVDSQIATLAELATTYRGLEMIWFDHHGNPPGHKPGVHCDFDSGCLCDPLSDQFWHRVDATMRQHAPDVLVGGIDLHIGPTSAGGAVLANHFSVCNLTQPNSTNNTATRCRSAVAGDSPFGDVYRPTEITDSAASGGWFWHPGTRYPSAESVAASTFALTGNGFNHILNFPPNASGLLDVAAVAAMQGAGDLARAFYASEVAHAAGVCQSGGAVALLLPAGVTVRAVLLREDLRHGQRVTRYSVTAANTAWSVSAGSIGQQRIHAVSSAAQDGLTAGSLTLHCEGVVGSANVTVVALSQPPPGTTGLQ